MIMRRAAANNRASVFRNNELASPVSYRRTTNLRSQPSVTLALGGTASKSYTRRRGWPPRSRLAGGYALPNNRADPPDNKRRSTVRAAIRAGEFVIRQSEDSPHPERDRTETLGSCARAAADAPPATPPTISSFMIVPPACYSFPWQPPQLDSKACGRAACPCRTYP